MAYSQIFSTIKFNSPFTLLTPNQRLQKSLSYQLLNQNQINQVTNSESVQSLSSWLNQQFDKLTIENIDYQDFHLISTVEQTLLWEHIINETDYDLSMVSKKSCIQNLIQANDLCITWMTNPENYKNQHYFGFEHTTFLDWNKKFHEICNKRKLLTFPMLFSLITNAIEDKKLIIDNSIYYYGFEQANPLQIRLFDLLSRYGNAVKLNDSKNSTCEKITYIEANDFCDEIEKAITWSKQVHKKSKNVNIGIVIPELNQKRPFVEVFLKKIINTELLKPGYDLKNNDYSISSGIPLIKIPLVKTALDFISFLNFESNNIVSIERFISILSSPLLFQNIDLPTRRSIINKLRNFSTDKITIDELFALCNKHQKDNLFDWHTLNTLQKKLNGKNQSYNAWSIQFIELLKLSDWLNKSELDSHDYQATTRFYLCLQELSKIDYIFEACSFRKALTALIHICENEIFQIEDTLEHRKNIHVLGLLEADLQDFTHLWICGFSNEDWPPKEKPNPFLPVQFQKALSMPHSSPERELEISQHLTKNFQTHCSQHLCFSFSKQKNGNDSFISKILPESNYSLSFPNDNSKIEKLINKLSLKESFNDENPLPLRHEEYKQGGQSILKNQAACSFKAFATHRLNLEANKEIPKGISALDRGNILHRLLDLIWKTLKTHERLCSLSEAQLKTLISDQVKILDSDFKNIKLAYPLAFNLEIERACSIAFNFIQNEKQRGSFHVEGIEQTITVNLQDITIKLRIDRIDSLADGSYLIIDYKSSSNAFKDWQTPKINEPQLPLYILALNNVSAISWVCLNQDETQLGYKGIGNSGEICQGIEFCEDTKIFNTSWDRQKQLWEDDLLLTAKEFSQGINLVNPKYPFKTCEYCDFSSLCRISDIKG